MLLTDVCRACFVERVGDGTFAYEDSIARTHRALYERYAAANEHWTWARVVGCRRELIVALGGRE